jgi:Holliday junction DNA helicase RuvA
MWEELEEGATVLLHVHTYVREDRLELFAFLDKATRHLFTELLNLQGIGPKIALELCAVPRGMLLQAVTEEDSSLLQNIKGIGKKTAEKLLLELKSLAEKHPTMFASGGSGSTVVALDTDAVAALAQLGYSRGDIVTVLKKIPNSLRSTEERVAAALRSL